jgi:alpha-tubulin suppressor-like RCC1 family protein
MKYIFAILTVLALLLSVVLGQTHSTLSGGYSHFVEIKPSGLYAWGVGNYGALGLGSGTTQSPTPMPVPLSPALTGVAVSVCTGTDFTCVLDDNGGVACTGVDLWGQMGDGNSRADQFVLGIPTGVSSVAHLACGYKSVLVATTTGALKTWGANGNGQLGLTATQKVWEAELVGSCLLVLPL